MKPLDSYFEILACVARADGRIAPEERDSLAAAISSSGLEPAIADRVLGLLDLSAPLDVDQVLSRAASSLTPAMLAEILRDSYAMALLDGEIHPREIALVERLLVVAGVGDGTRAALHTSGEAAARQHLDGVELLREAMGPCSSVTPAADHPGEGG